MRFLKRTPQATGWLGLDLAQPTVHAAHIERDSDGAPRLKALAVADTPGTDPDTLGRLKKALGSETHRCTSAIDPTHYQIMQINVPPVPENERNSAILWSIKDTLSFPLDDTLVQSMDIPADGSPIGHTRLVLAIAARRSSVLRHSRAIELSGFRIGAVDIVECCQRNLSRLFEEPGRATAFVSFDQRGGRLTFSHRGELYATRRLETTAFELIAGASLDVASVGQHVYDRVALELQRSLDNFDRLFSLLAVDRLLVAPGPGMDSFVSYIRPQLPRPVALADLRDVLPTSGEIHLGTPLEQAPWFTAIGLALRDESPHVAAQKEVDAFKDFA